MFYIMNLRSCLTEKTFNELWCTDNMARANKSCRWLLFLHGIDFTGCYSKKMWTVEYLNIPSAICPLLHNGLLVPNPPQDYQLLPGNTEDRSRDVINESLLCHKILTLVRKMIWVSHIDLHRWVKRPGSRTEVP